MPPPETRDTQPEGRVRHGRGGEAGGHLRRTGDARTRGGVRRSPPLVARLEAEFARVRHALHLEQRRVS